MSTYKTKNPLGSPAAKDLFDNAENLDVFANDRTKEVSDDRLGVLRKTWYGMEMIFDRFISYITGRGEQAVGAIGWQELGNWAAGLTVDNRQQIVYYNGSWYKYLGELEHVISGDSPENDGGVWSAENPTGKWSNIGDAALRSNLGSSEEGFGADLVQTTVGITVGEIARAPAAITGRVNIVNARWNAPSLYAEEPEAAAANAAAINMMFSAGGRHVELDTKARCVNSPLIFQSSLGIYGAGRETTSLIWTGGDLPALARPNYTDKDAKGFSNVRVHNLKIVDQALERNSYYTIDLFNGNSSGLDDCWIDCPGRYDANGNQIITSDRYGVALGIARNSTLKGDNGFVFHMRNSRIAKGTLMANGTDGYISGCELWGNFRNRAVEISGGCTVDGGTQIVPGHESGIFLFNDKGYNIDTLKILGVYFDGSTDMDLFTGWGILSAAGIGLVNAKIIGCDFWNMNKGGIYAAKLYSTTIESNNFTDCDSDDTGEDDIYCDDVYGSSIVNVHARSLAPKNNNATRVNLGRNYSITAKLGYPLSTLGGPVSFNTTYARSRVTNPTYARQAGGSFASSFPYGALPDAAARYGEVIVVNGKPYASDGASWRDMSGDTLALETATDLHALAVSQRYYTSDITMHSNIPAGLTGAAQIEVGYISAGYRVITVISLKASGGIYKQLLTGGTTPTWGLWLKIA
ncbi:hypothetical protein ACHCAK_22335 [Raoultella ornithinolytica]|uniref:hypothetical protein n=1 Tax=Raoultella ornithinolytica TaxID=54291 RepID=UPI002274774A|nr:hypothetical protein [Raoultella ornithinolytica]EKU0200080.1 hypothetical protein [Raoultella ornithinolytica]EKU0200687.1 hypothetical protein [Raoultella ornithinolytica]EKV4103458.1 hypothetical protein [Raoultella ornithinolytica]EKV8288457.1 hypothetical protein [Raoultella ornithinolytica]